MALSDGQDWNTPMQLRRWTSPLWLLMALPVIATAPGCAQWKGLTQADHPSTVAPLLSTVPDQTIDSEAKRSATSSQMTASAASLVPPAPDSGQMHPPRIVQTAGHATGESATTPNQPPPAPPASAPLQAVPTFCLPSEAEWRIQFEEQTQALQNRIESLETQLTAAREALIVVNAKLDDSKSEIEQLRSQSQQWQSEVRRLETRMVQQQQDDLNSLDELTVTLQKILVQQQLGQATEEAHE